MNKSLDFLNFRDQYKEFYYNSFQVSEDDEAIYMEFEFEIPGLTKFNPTIKYD